MNRDAFDPRLIRGQLWGYLKYLNGLQEEWKLMTVTASRTLGQEILMVRGEIRMWTMVDEVLSRDASRVDEKSE